MMKSVHFDVMISYQWDSKERMMKFRDKLKNAGLSVWTDSVWMDAKQMGGSLDDFIANAVENSDTVLICYSRKYQESVNCKKEAEYAYNRQKRIIPLRCDDHKPTGWLGLLLGNRLYYDVRTDQELDDNFVAILEAIDPQQFADIAPSEVRLRGPAAVEAYQKALEDGSQEVHSVRVMLVGQERVGKTSLVKAFMGDKFKKDQGITDGVDTSNMCAIPLSPDSDPTDWEARYCKPEELMKQLEEKQNYGLRSAIEQELDEHEKRKEEETSSSVHVSSSQTQPSDEDSRSDPDELHDSEFPSPQAEMQKPQQDNRIPKEVTQAVKPPDELEITFWDFAGQNMYYTTHQVFFNSRAIFVLVFNMRHQFEDRCMVGDFSSASDKKTRQFDDFTGEDFFKFWLQSIYTYAVQDAADAGNVEGYPPILIIGTHKRDPNAMGEGLAKDKIFRIIKGKPYEPYIRRKFHFLENNPADQQQPSDDEALKLLKEAIARTAKDAPHIKEKYPINWINFHKAVLEEVAKGHHYMDYKKVKDLAAEQNVTDESQITTMLNLYHDMGIIIWYGDHGQSLKNTVILNPQWLIDVFKAVITVKPDEEQDGKFSDLWQELQEHGILREKLIDHVWDEWKDIKGPLLEIMEKFDIVVKNISKDEGEKEKDDADTDVKQSLVYCVPACLQPVNRSENIQDGTFYVDFHTFLPDGFFHRVLVYFARWSSAHTGEPFSLYYRKCESFVGRAENLHECSLLMIPSSASSQSASIKVVVKRVAEHGHESTQRDPDPEVCTRVYEFMAKTLQELRDKWAKGITYQMSICCIACRDEGREKLHLIPVEKCKRSQHVYCPEVKKNIPARMLYWNVKTDTPSVSDKPTASEAADQNKKEKGVPSSNDKSSKSETAEPNKQGHIMISYSWGKEAERFPCKQRMKQLRDELQKAGFKVWLDCTGDLKGNLDVGMAEAVDNASVILLCFSKEYQESGSCRKEAQYATYQSKTIIPLKFDGHRPDGWLGLLIGPLMYYDVRTEEAMKNSLPAITKCIREICSKGNAGDHVGSHATTGATKGNMEGDQDKRNSDIQDENLKATDNTDGNMEGDKGKKTVVPSQPDKPIGEIANKTNVRIVWSAPENDGGSPVSRYVIEQSSGSSGKWIRKEEVTSTTYTDRDLTPGNGYKYRVAAVNSVGSSQFSDATSLLEIPSAVPSQPDKPIGELVNETSIKIIWSAPEDDGGYPIRYVIEQSSGSSGNWIRKEEVTSTTYTDRDLTPGNGYKYRVAAVNSVGSSQFSDATSLLEIPSAYLVSPTYFLPVACIGAAAAVILWIVWFG